MQQKDVPFLKSLAGRMLLFGIMPTGLVLTAVAIITFLWTWNEFLFAVMLVNSPEKRVLTVGIESFIGEFELRWMEC